jgi:hypothetical protein
MPHLLLRYDDFAASGCFGPRASDVERRLVEAFGARGVPLAVAVVPRARRGDVEVDLASDAEAVSRLRAGIQAGIMEPVLHGLTHAAHAFTGGARSELVGRSRVDQAALLREGRERLEGTLGARVEAFAPPWGTHDAATVDALVDAGFTVFSPALWGGPFPSGPRPLAWLPATVELRDLATAVQHLRGLGVGDGVVVAAVLHAYDFAESDDPRAWMSAADVGPLLGRCRELGFEPIRLHEAAASGTATAARAQQAARAAKVARALGRRRLMAPAMAEAFAAALWPEGQAWRQLARACGLGWRQALRRPA